MGALASSAVSLYPTVANGGLNTAQWTEGGPVDKKLLVRRLKLVLTGQGSQTNTIGADALGFAVLVDCSTLFDDTNNVGYPAVVDPVANVILLLDGAAAPAPVDVTSSAAYITVRGFAKVAPAV